MSLERGRSSHPAMDKGSVDVNPLDYLSIRYRICGMFVKTDGVMKYVDGTVGLYHMERDQLCYEEIMELMKDLISAELECFDDKRQVKIHWLFPGKAVDDGLSLLYNDASVQRMDSHITDGRVADLYVQHFEYDSEENEKKEDSEWEPDNEEEHVALSCSDKSDEEVAEESVGLVNIRLAETYSKQKGTKLPLVPVQAVETEYVISLLSDDPIVPTIEDDMHKGLAARSSEEELGHDAAGSTPKRAKKDSAHAQQITLSKEDLDAELRKFREIYGYSQEDKKNKKVKRSLIPAKAHPQRKNITPLAPKVSSEPHPERKKSKRKENETSEREQDAEENSEEETDTEYVPPECSLGENSEAEQIRKLAREIRRQKRAKKMGATTGPIVKDNNVVEESDGALDAGDDSDYFDSDDDCSYDEESDGEGGKLFKRRKSSWPRYDSKADSPKFQLGMVFRGKEQMKKALIKYGIKEHVHLLFTKDEKNKVRAHCSWPGCKWMIYASTTSKNKWLQVSTLVDEHHCIPRRDNNLVTAQVTAAKYGRLIKANPTWKLENIKETILEDLGVDVHISKCKRAKQIVLQKLFDSTHGEYSKVFDYQLELLRSNPGSTVHVMLDPDQPDGKHVFMRFYMCFHACKKGFLAGCRRVIGLDGCFFKGACYGQLLCALGRDANNQMYPIAWTVVEKETTDSWMWFLNFVDKDLKIKNQGEGWVFISDQHKGIIGAIEAIVPKAEHRMCARHIYANWKKEHPDHDLQKRFWRCAKSPNRILFNYNRARLAQVTPEGAQDMMKTSPEHWSRAYLKLGSNCDSVDNNMCESFNNWVLESRYLPIISMLEWIRCKVMVRIQENRTKASKWQGRICPNVFKKLKQNINRSSNCHVLWNGKDGFEIKEHDRFKFIVSLQKRECTCRYWQLSGLPCCHAISAIYKSSQQVDDFIARCFSIEDYHKIYDHCLEPLEGEESWPTAKHPRPLAPGFIRMPGRPKVERRREPGEAPNGSKMSKVGIKITCSLCHKQGHNIKSCKNSPNHKHNQNADIVKQATKKRKADKEAFEAENAKRAAKGKLTRHPKWLNRQSASIIIKEVIHVLVYLNVFLLATCLLPTSSDIWICSQ